MTTAVWYIVLRFEIRGFAVDFSAKRPENVPLRKSHISHFHFSQPACT